MEPTISLKEIMPKDLQPDRFYICLPVVNILREEQPVWLVKPWRDGAYIVYRCIMWDDEHEPDRVVDGCGYRFFELPSI